MDRLSCLPDSILSEILAYLSTDEAIRTKTLSKQWQNLCFPMHDELVFLQPSKGSHVYVNEIANFINRAFPIDTCSTITKCEIRLPRQVSMFKFIDAVVLRHVKEFILEFPEKQQCFPVLPDSLCSYKALESLTLRHHFFIYRNWKFSWMNLKALTLEFITMLQNDFLEDIFAGSPNLDHLELNECYGFDRIFSKTLRRLVITQCDNATEVKHDNTVSIAIGVPKVECLILKLYMEFELLDVSSLVDVAIDFTKLYPSTLQNSELYPSIFGRRQVPKRREFESIERRQVQERREFQSKYHRDILRQFSSKVVHAERVRMGAWCIKIVSTTVMKAMQCPVSLPKCKTLLLETPLSKWDVPGILSILRRSQNLETLVVLLTTGYNPQLSSWDQDGDEFGEFDAEIYRENEKNVSRNMLQHLKRVEMVGLSTQSVDVAKFLLQNAYFLQKIVLKINKSFRKDDQSQIVQKILSLPSSSPSVQIFVS